ncbi:hypothetical protein BEC77_14675 [Escherichia coli]|nr:hypothetical protein [Escherichia coli]MCH6842446.1 hypothetical protein [Escherichia coli]MCH6867862.1 hypothetical protein [Escherichia coli]OWD40649.1 hypothetical protein A8C66_05555 [Escherichia coli]
MSGWRFIGRGIVFHLFIDQLFELFRCQIDLLIQRVETFTLDHRGELQAHLFCIRRATVHGGDQRERIAFLVVGTRQFLRVLKTKRHFFNRTQATRSF